ncbi:MAG: glycosyltransferase family 9 protein [Bryobacteraceae bacterium]
MTQNPPRILVVRLGAMGDIVHALPAVASLKQGFPGAHLTWVVEPQWAVLLEGNPFVDRVILLRRRDAAGLLASWRELRSAGFDFAVDFQGLLKSAVVAAAARPERIFGWDRGQLREAAAGVFYTNRASSAAAHVVDRNLDLAAAAGAAHAVRVFPLPAGRPEGPLPDGAFVLASPLAGWRAKQWPFENYLVLARLLMRECSLPLVLNAPPGSCVIVGRLDTLTDESVCPTLPSKDLQARGSGAFACQQTPSQLPAASHGTPAGVWPHACGLPGLIDATRRAAAVVGVDSGPMHLAAALGKPGVALFGPTDPARNGPYGDSLRVLRGPGAVTTYKRIDAIDESMRRITPEEVFDSLRAALGCAHGSDGCVAG